MVSSSGDDYTHLDFLQPHTASEAVLRHLPPATGGLILLLTSLLMPLMGEANPSPNMSSPGTLVERCRQLAPPPQFLLFGDSITQGASILQHALSDRYLRRLDVLNRGFGGYNTSDGLAVFPSFFPSIPPSRLTPRVLAITILFGANDSCAPGQTQHVPLALFAQNLREMIASERVKSHHTNVILITPAPVEEYRLVDGDNRAMSVARYAQAVRELGSELEVPVFDLWAILMARAGWDVAREPSKTMPGCKAVLPSQILGKFFYDGLHFTDLGYRIFLEELVSFLEREIPELQDNFLKSWYPEWTEFHP